MEIQEVMSQIDEQRKEQDAVYHNMAVKFGLSDTAMMILYFAADQRSTVTQQEVCNACFVPKQTVNTAIAGLVQKGLVELELIPGTRNKKRILLTEKGWHLAANTTEKLRAAELRAYGRLSEEELQSFLDMTRRLTVGLREETEKI